MAGGDNSLAHQIAAQMAAEFENWEFPQYQERLKEVHPDISEAQLDVIRYTLMMVLRNSDIREATVAAINQRMTSAQQERFLRLMVTDDGRFLLQMNEALDVPLRAISAAAWKRAEKLLAEKVSKPEATRLDNMANRA